MKARPQEPGSQQDNERYIAEQARLLVGAMSTPSGASSDYRSVLESLAHVYPGAIGTTPVELGFFAPRAPLSNWSSAAVIPDDATVNGVFREYLYSLYVMFPISVRSEILAEVAANSLPDYFVYTILFFTLWWNRESEDLIERSVSLSSMVRWIFDRVQTTLLPALERTLCGYDALFGNTQHVTAEDEASKEEYKRNAVYVIMSLLHLLAVAINFRNPGVVPFSDYKLMLQLAVRTARAARLNCQDIYCENWASLLETRACPPLLLERARRAWWSLTTIDRHLSIMYDDEPEIQVEECTTMELGINDLQYEHMKRTTQAGGGPSVAGKPLFAAVPARSTTTPEPSAQSPKSDVRHLYPFSSTSTEMIANLLVSRSTSGSPLVGTTESAFPNFPAAGAPPQHASPIIQHPRLQSSIGLDGTFSPAASYHRLFFLFERIMTFRRSQLWPYASSPQRTTLLAELNRWHQELPGPWKMIDTTVLRKPAADSPSNDIGSRAKDARGQFGMIGWVFSLTHPLLDGPSFH